MTAIATSSSIRVNPRRRAYIGRELSVRRSRADIHSQQVPAENLCPGHETIMCGRRSLRRKIDIDVLDLMVFDLDLEDRVGIVLGRNLVFGRHPRRCRDRIRDYDAGRNVG